MFTWGESANLVPWPLCLVLKKKIFCLAVITHLFFQPLAEHLILLCSNGDFITLEIRVLLKTVLLHVSY